MLPPAIETPPAIIEYQPGTQRADFNVGNLLVHDFTSTTGADLIRAPEHSVFLLGHPVTVTDIWQGQRQRQIEYQAGDMIFLPAATDVRATFVSNAYSETMVRIPWSACAAVMGLVTLENLDLRYKPIRGGLAPALIPAIQQLATISGSGTLAPILIESASTMLIAGLAAIMSPLAHRTIYGLSDGLTDRRLARTIDYMEANLHKPLGLHEIASVAALSTYHFARSFKRHTGVTPARYLWNRRLARAQLLLANATIPIIEVAAACGFTSQAHFTTAFGRAFGVTPAAWRAARI